MSALINSGEEALHYELVRDGGEHTIHYCDQDLPAVYCLQRCVQWIKSRGLQKVVLQFPQEFSCDAPLVLLLLRQQTGLQDLSIIFNSSAAKCCVGQKDADYRSREAVIQFGRSCLTPVPRVPVLRVMAPHWRVAPGEVVDGICRVPEVAQMIISHGDCRPAEEEASQQELVVLYDTRCAYAMSEVEQRLRERLSNFQMSRLVIPDDPPTPQGEAPLNGTSAAPQSCDGRTSPEGVSCVCSLDYSLGLCLYCTSRRHLWRKVAGDEGGEEGSGGGQEEEVFLLNGRFVKLTGHGYLSNVVFVFVGRVGPTLTAMTLQCPQRPFYALDPDSGAFSSTNAAKIVMQRNFKIEQIKDAQKIGLLVSNYSLPRYHEIFARFTSLIKKAGKKPFVQYSAHPDLPKLMNIPNIDVFVYIACPESTVIERHLDPDLYKLMVTPWELEVALNPKRTWRLNFETDACELLEGGRCYEPLPEWEVQEQQVSVSLLNNRTQSFGDNTVTSGPAGDEPLTGKTGAVSEMSERQLARLADGLASGLVYGDTRWFGLQPDAGEGAPLGTVVQGRSGVAGGYSEEGAGDSVGPCCKQEPGCGAAADVQCCKQLQASCGEQRSSVQCCKLTTVRTEGDAPLA